MEMVEKTEQEVYACGAYALVHQEQEDAKDFVYWELGAAGLGDSELYRLPEDRLYVLQDLRS